MKFPKKCRSVKVTWLDAFNPDPKWTQEKNMKRNSKFRVKTLGFILFATDEYLVLCRDWGSAKLRGGLFYVPLGCIKKIRVVR